MKITISAIGKDNSSTPTSQLFQKYIQRIPWSVELHEIDSKKKLPPNALKNHEADLLLKTIPKTTITIALDEKGIMLNSTEFANQIATWQKQGHSKLSFIIGGANGLGHSIFDKSQLTLSLSKMTLPHILARTILAEQLYRAHTIINQHPYHKQ